MLARHELLNYCHELLNVDHFTDYCPNGLQVEGATAVRFIVAGVTASEALIHKAIAMRADTLLVHHGYFWKNETLPIVGMKKRRIELLLKHNLNLIAYHLPLDAHPELGNNAQLAKVLSFENSYVADDLLFIGELFQHMDGMQLQQHLAQRLNRQPLWISANSQDVCENKKIKNVAWCTGAAQDYIYLAIEKGADAFISGEISEATVHIARENGIHYYAAGHHATERYGVKALAEHLAAHFDVDQCFIDIDNPV